MNKLVLITGGSRGIGATLVKHFVESGFNVAFTYNKSAQLANKIVSESTGKAQAFHLDINDETSISDCISKISNYYGKNIDILINNAAIAQEKDFLKISKEDFDVMMRANLYAPILLSQLVIPKMIDNKWGKIINIGSIGGQWGGINQVHYAAAKAGLINFTRSITKMYAKDGISSHCISIGLVETDMTKNELSTQQGQAKVESIPIGRLGHKEEIAKIAIFLASNDSQYLTGQTLNANGGMYLC
ncbi:SDR family NAD(P)-dependent oxidoreductase [Plesiomonas shigelloides]|uniref:SDR family NAD(P)-dependent oxidoreductase n=1 Tax=Plesiomonas shigelloides TaxID=703 RepID=UPI002FCBDA9D